MDRFLCLFLTKAVCGAFSSRKLDDWNALSTWIHLDGEVFRVRKHSYKTCQQTDYLWYSYPWYSLPMTIATVMLLNLSIQIQILFLLFPPQKWFTNIFSLPIHISDVHLILPNCHWCLLIISVLLFHLHWLECSSNHYCTLRWFLLNLQSFCPCLF